MKQKILGVLLGLSLLLALMPTTVLADGPEGPPVPVTIFATNDLHGNIEHSDAVIGLAQTAAIKASTPDALLVDAGDATQGASFATASKGADVISVMNAAGYDVMAAGNHEFDYGTGTLLNNAAAAGFPILAANVRKDGKPLLETSCVKEAAGKKIGFIGLTTVSTATSTNPAQLSGVTFAGEVETARAEIAALSDRADAIVLICHMGENDTAVDCTSKALLEGLTAEERGRVAAVIDGHSHQTYADEYEGIPIVQAGVNGTSMGRVDLLFSGDTTVSARGSVLTYDEAMAYELTDGGLAAAAKVEDTLAAIRESQKAVLDQTLCEAVSPLWGGYVYYDYVESRIVETAYGDFVTDAFLDSARAFAANNGLDLPVVAVENGGGIAQTMPMGTVTRGDVLNAFNHGNLVVALSVTPAQLYTALEAGLTMTGQDDTGLLVRERVSGSFLQAGGFSYTYDPAGEAGAKVTEVTLDGGKKLSRDDTSTRLLLATNNYAATFAGLSEGEQLGELGGEDLIVEEYILSQTGGGTEKLTYPLTQGRIRIAGDKSPETYGVAIPVLSSADKTTPLAGRTFHLKVDGGDYVEMTTDENGTLAVTGLSKGPHQFFLREAGGQAVYVNNYSGSGTVTTKEGYYRLGFLADDGVPFTDVSAGAWYRGAVAYVYQNGLMRGMGGGLFTPDGTVTRAQMAMALWNMRGRPVVDYYMDYSDAVEGLWYSEAVRWAASEGIAVGYGNGRFGPGDPVTREQMAAMIYRYEQKYGSGGFTGSWMYHLPFTDLEAISDWAFEAVAWCGMKNVLEGGEAGAFDPAGHALRCELAAALMRYCENAAE